MTTINKPTSVDEYIAAAAPPARSLLQTLRKTIQQAAPGATEKLSYGMPYYHFHGRLVYFAAFKNHIGFYAMKSPIKAFAKELEGYETLPATIHFSLNKPLPIDLIKRIVRFRVQENLDKAKT